MTAYEIPLSPKPQAFNIALGGVTYNLTFKWNTNSQVWVLDIADADLNPLVGGLPLVPGADLLAQYEYLGFTGRLIVQMDHDLTAVPAYEDLGVNGHVFWVQ